MDQPCFVDGRKNHWAKDYHYKKTEPCKPKPKWNKGQWGPKAQVNVLVDQDDQDEPNLRAQVEMTPSHNYVELKMTYGKALTLKDVRHVPDVRKKPYQWIVLSTTSIQNCNGVEYDCYY
ncbi:unnamed protein product [Prunus armeniaca]